MINYLQNVLKEYDYPLDAKEQIISDAKKLFCKEFYSLISPYENDYNADISTISYQISQLAKQKGVDEYPAQLIFYLALTKPLKKHYEKQNLPLSSYTGVINDLKYKAKECFLIYKIWGTFVSGWHEGFFKLKRFNFGRLQFEMLPFNKLFKHFESEFLPADTPVINVHIPRNGQSLNSELVGEAYKTASDFYRDKLNANPVIFVCESWLLYPKNLQVLSQNSNIRKFISNYQIILSQDYPDYSEVWRLFDCKYTGNAKDLPADSSLRRAYINWISNGEPIGFGLGVYFYDQK
ncbi:MAG: hypothetical protein IKZ38_00945 [Clostridia bacterium]|nr:hypothetical protein [Clostridia bacterium]